MKEVIRNIIKEFSNQCDYFEIRIEKFDEQRIVVSNDEVEAVNNRIENGGNVRALVNGGWGFTSFNNLENLQEYAKKAIVQAKLVGKSKSSLAKVEPIEDEYETKLIVNPRDISLDDKIGLFRHYTKIIKDYSDEIKLGRVIYFDTKKEIIFANSEGTYIKQNKIDIGSNIYCISSRGSDTQTQYVSVGGNNDYSIMLDLDKKINEACKIAIELLDAPKIKGGSYTTIINPDLAGVFIHEAFGHLSEGDNVYENERLREILTLGGVFGSQILNVFDSGIEGNNRGDLPYDDEGVRTEKTYLIKEGKLVGRLHSRETAGKMGEQATGNARSLSYKFEPIPRMRVTAIENGTSTFEDMIKNIKFGVYAVGALGGQTTHELFTFSATHGYMIRDGKQCELVRDLNISGNVFETLKNIIAIGNDGQYCNSAGGCGKGGQFPLPVSEASPHIKIENLIIGGEAE